MACGVLAVFTPTGAFAREQAAGLPPVRQASRGLVWQAALDEPDAAGRYAEAVPALLAAFEEASGQVLEPGSAGRVGLKVYANSGPGLATPTALVEGVILALEQRGFARQSLFIIDASEAGLRVNGFLPPLSRMNVDGYFFNGVEVIPLDRGLSFDPTWYYDNPLPRQDFTPIAPSDEEAGSRPSEATEAGTDRISLLAKPLLQHVDFWINFPVVTDHPTLGVNGALANGTLWAVSNRDRFFNSPANGPIAVAEIAAIPELVRGWFLNFLSLEQYQFIGGPIFNSLYTRSEPLLWLSTDPLALDALMTDRINAARVKAGFDPLHSALPILDYAQTLSVGLAQRDRLQILPVR